MQTSGIDARNAFGGRYDSHGAPQLLGNSFYTDGAPVYLGSSSALRPPRPEPFSTVPFSQDPDFVNRGAILDQLRAVCMCPAARVALVGLGGVGKSQLVIQYSYQVREKSPQIYIFWVHASTRARFEEGYRTIADRLDLARPEDSDANILRMVRNWLCEEKNGRWIMILDNMDDAAILKDSADEAVPHSARQHQAPATLEGFLPQAPHGCVILTSRSEDVASWLTGGHKNIIRVGPMAEKEGLDILSNKLNIQYSEGTALALLEAVDYMPLAITQAAAYINRLGPRGSVQKYLEHFQRSERSRANLLHRDLGDIRRDRDALHSILVTWQISFNQMRDERSSAANLLSLMSFFDRQGIPEFILRSYARNQNPAADAGSDLDGDLEFEDDLATLRGYGLITMNVHGEAFEMHRLVQLATRKWIERYSDIDRWRQVFLKCLSTAYPTGEYEQWSRCEVLFPHATVTAAEEPTDPESLRDWSRILTNAAWYAVAKGRYEVGKSMVHKAVSTHERIFEEEHAATRWSLSIYAELLRCQGKYEAAEEMSRRVLKGSEKVLGADHPDTLTSVSSLAGVLRYQGKHGAAEKMNRRALEGREKALGADHPDTLTSVSNLAGVLRYQGKYDTAEEMNRRALKGSEKVLGADHPDTLTTVYCLAYLLHQRKRYIEAEHFYRRASSGFGQALGENHPTTAACSRHYSSMHQEQNSRGDCEGSELREAYCTE
ncbi:MAG: hypothetical protein Q9164_006829 [Protoblastenia rupestris]